MQPLRNARLIARLVLVWFALSLGAAIASPLVAPKAMLLVCSGASVKLIVQGADGEMTEMGHSYARLPAVRGNERAAARGERQRPAPACAVTRPAPHRDGAHRRTYRHPLAGPCPAALFLNSCIHS